MSRSYFVMNCEVTDDGVVEVKLENGKQRAIYGKLYSREGTWVGASVAFGPEYCYFTSNSNLWRRERDLLDFGIYISEEDTVEEEPAYFEEIAPWGV